MLRSAAWHRILPATFVVLLIAADGDEKKGCSCKKDRIDTDTQVENTVQRPEVTLQVSSVDPSRIPANTETRVTVLGAGFEQGATVKFGTAEGTRARAVDGNQLAVSAPALPAGAYDVVVTLPNGTSATLRRGLTAEEAAAPTDCGDITVRFDFDRDNLRPDAQTALDAKAACYAAGTATIRLEGHADERGTTDYNLALGQRRADSVKRYLQGKGVAAGRLSTVSFGEERPANNGHSEGAWAENRRVEIHVAR
jgi:peptidoglycan-associated lipoprotein